MNLQTEVKRKVLLDSEYLSFRWSGGFDYGRGPAQILQPNGVNGNGMNGFNNGYNGYNGYNNYNGFNGINGVGGGLN